MLPTENAGCNEIEWDARGWSGNKKPAKWRVWLDFISPFYFVVSRSIWGWCRWRESNRTASQTVGAKCCRRLGGTSVPLSGPIQLGGW